MFLAKNVRVRPEKNKLFFQTNGNFTYFILLSILEGKPGNLYPNITDLFVQVNEQSQSGLGELSQEEDGEPSTDQTLDTVTLNENNVENGEAQTMRRVITDTGDIVETATITEEGNNSC